MAVFAGAALGGCGSGDEPTEAEWLSRWERERDSVPTVEQMIDGGREYCDDLNGQYRERLPGIESPPIEVLDDTVREWIDEVEDLVFDCPDDPTEIAQRLDQIDILTAEIDAALDLGG